MKTNLITVKAVLIAALVLLMLIPVGMVKSLIEERSIMKESIRTDISGKWGGNQTFTGPVLVLPYERGNHIEYAYFLPEELNITGSVKPEVFPVGIYKVTCYRSDMNMNGRFQFPDYTKLNLTAEQIQWKDAFFLIGISHIQGVKNKLIFNLNGKPQEMLSNARQNDLMASGLTVKMPIDPVDAPKTYDFDFDLALNGTDELNFTPAGNQTRINLKYDWNNVGFTGDFRPNQKTEKDGSANAEWNILDYNRNYPSMWSGKNNEFTQSLLGVDLRLPIDHYEKSMRSAKYAVLFIALTFLVFFLVELISHKRIHPFQYLLVSFALALFYCLLLAFSEHIGFNWAYLVSATAIISLITAYSKTVFNSLKQTVIMFVFLLALYAFLYVLLQLEDLALLVGSIGLFIALAAVMYASRKVNWYKESKE